MKGVAESNIIEEMLGVEKNACQVLEEAKEKGNRMVLQARSEARKLIEKTKEALQEEIKSLTKTLYLEGEERVEQIAVEKEKSLNRMKEQAVQKRELVLKELREILFGDL